MPLISPTERSWLNKGRDEGIEKGRRESIEKGLGKRFGEARLKLLPVVKTIRDQTHLEQILDALWNGNSIDEIAALLPQVDAKAAP